jgi:hypothetical protein
MTTVQKLESLGIKPIYEEYYPLTKEDIQEVTGIIGEPLPANYIQLVSTYGCAYFPGHQVEVKCIDSPPPDISDDPFLPISSLFGGGDKQHRLVQQVKDSWGRIPHKMIPIASDYNGNWYCLTIAGRNAGSVFFWDATREFFPDDSGESHNSPSASIPSNTTLIATSLEDFIDRLEITA